MVNNGNSNGGNGPDKDVMGILVSQPALSVSSNGGVASASAFATTIGLVR
jgi:hypothetical protein